MSDNKKVEKNPEDKWVVVETIDISVSSSDDSEDSDEFPILRPAKVRRTEPEIRTVITIHSESSTETELAPEEASSSEEEQDAMKKVFPLDSREALTQYYVDRNELAFPVNDFSTSSGSSPRSPQGEEDKENIEGTDAVLVASQKSGNDADSESDSFVIITKPTDDEEKHQANPKMDMDEYNWQDEKNCLKNNYFCCHFNDVRPTLYKTERIRRCTQLG